jgi:Peptidase A4 family
MRRSWLIAIATGTLAFGGMLATAGPSAASPVLGHPQTRNFTPGGLARGMTGEPRGGAFTQVVRSANWAGYVASGGNGEATSVTSDWVQPTARCRFGDQYSAFWVGLDGFTSSTVEQTGTEADCVGRTAEYAAWYEFYPANPVYFNEPVRAGDQFTGTVSYASGQFTVTLTDHTQSWSQSHTQVVPGAARSSAEVIAEAPCCTYGGNPLPLTNFGSVSFNSAMVNGAGLCTTNPVEVEMVSAHRTLQAEPSPISGCESFRVADLGGGGFWAF